MAYANKQRYSQAVVELKKAIALDKTPERMWVLTEVYDNWGKRQEAHATLQELVRMSTHSYTPPQVIAGFYARFGVGKTVPLFKPKTPRLVVVSALMKYLSFRL